MIRRRQVTENNQTSSFNVLFTCLSLLLLCFFIFLVANSVIDPKKKKVSIGSLIGSFGFYKGGILILGNAKKKEIGFAIISISKKRDILDNLKDIVKYSRRDRWIEIATEGNYIVMNFKKNSVFKNREELKPVYKNIILKSFISIANRSENINVKIYSFNNDPYISAIRGFKVANMLISTGLVNKNNIKFYAKVENSRYDLEIKFSGNVRSQNNASGFKVGDFFFKLY